MSEIDERRRITYGSRDDEIGVSIFIPACTHCGRFAKADAMMSFRVTGTSEAGLSLEPKTPNAHCQKCGRTGMLWEGFE